ncbi:MAG: GTPase Era [Bacillota bacterium]
MFVSGFIAVVGRPNVGKSTLINALIGKKVLIVSPRPQTTRNRIHTIYTGEDTQLIFLDTPGIHSPRHRLGDYMLKAATDALTEVDLILFLVEAGSSPGPGDRKVAALLQEIATPVLLVINKMDMAAADFDTRILPRYRQLMEFQGIFQVSALQEQNLEPLRLAIREHLPSGPQYYPPDMTVDRPEEFLAAEIIREKIMEQTHEEVPHAVAVQITAMEIRRRGEMLLIRAEIFVEKDSQKKIIIGKGGGMLKHIGTAARRDLEKLLGNAVFLELWVKVKKDWRSRDNVLRQLGYDDG